MILERQKKNYISPTIVPSDDMDKISSVLRFPEQAGRAEILGRPRHLECTENKRTEGYLGRAFQRSLKFPL